MSTQAEYHYSLTSATGRWTLVSTILASAMAFIDSSALNVVLASLQNDLNASGTDLFWVINSYLLMLAALIILGGSLGDKLGRVKIFMVGISIFAIASVLCGLAPDIFTLIVFRGLQGVGGALMIPGSLSIISATFTNKEKGRAIGLWSAITTLVTIGGPVLGGALADAGWWRAIFYLNVPLALVALIILHFKVPESKQNIQQNQLDYLGAGLLVTGLALFTYGLLEMPETGWKAPKTLLTISAGLILCMAFIRVELKKNNPIVDLSLFKNSYFSILNVVTFFLYAALGTMLLFLPLNIIQIQKYTQLEAGLAFLPFSVAMITLARLIGKWYDKYGANFFLIVGPMITGIGFYWLSTLGITQGFSDYWTTFFPPILCFSLGMTMVVIPLTSAVMSSVPDEYAGVASGINNSLTRIANVFNNAILGSMAVIIFTTQVSVQIKSFSIKEPVQQEIINEAKKLGEATVPDSLPDLNLRTQLQDIYQREFIYVYSLVGKICAVLAFMAGLMLASYFLVTSRKDRLKQAAS